MAVTLLVRRFLERTVDRLEEGLFADLRSRLSSGGDLFDWLEAQDEGVRKRVLEALAEALGEAFVQRDEPPTEWVQRAVYVGHRYLLLGGSEEGEVEGLFAAFPYEDLHLEAEERHGWSIQARVVEPRLLALVSRRIAQERPEILDILLGEEARKPSSLEGTPLPGLIEVPSPTPASPQALPPLPEALGEAKSPSKGGCPAFSLGALGSPLYPQYELADLEEPDPNLVAALPRNLVQEFKAVPYRMEGNKVVVLMVEPQNLLAVDTIGIVLRRPIQPALVSEVTFQAFLDRAYGEGFGKQEEAGELLGEAEAEEETRNPEEDSEARKFVFRVLREAYYADASDVHFEPTRTEAVVRMRVDGTLRDFDRVRKAFYPSVVSVIKILSGMDIGEKRLPQDGRLRYTMPHGERLDFRVSTVPANYGERVVLRLLKKASDIPEIEGLGFLPDTLEAFKGLISKPYGLILVTGPTGSGKSFTNFSVLKRVAGPDKNVLTVEDPIEYEIPGISQVQVKASIGLTFARVLRAFLRQDPDVIMVGEIRDSETAKIATEAALTGHLVLATLHTNDAPQAVTRLEEMGVERYNVAASLLGVLAQRLARKLCSCAVPSPPEKVEEYRAAFAEAGLSIPQDATFREPVGCKVCGGTGYKGRIPIHELMVVTPPLRQAILSAESASALKEEAVRHGMRTLKQDGLLKAAKGLTTVQEVIQRTID